MGLRFSKGITMSHKFIPTTPPLKPAKVVKKICRFCKVEIAFVKDGHPYPVLGKQHKKSCPRSRNCN